MGIQLKNIPVNAQIHNLTETLTCKKISIYMFDVNQF